MADLQDPRVDYENRPLSDEEKRYLHEWSRDDLVEINERLFGQSKAHEKGQPVNVAAALRDAGVELVPAPNNPIAVAGRDFTQGPVVVEGENDVPPGPGSGGTRVELPRDHPLTAPIDANLGEAETEEFDAKAVRAEINELTVEELKDNLRELDKPVDGNKAELQKRLFQALKEEHEKA
jgi:hypothetical protein